MPAYPSSDAVFSLHFLLRALRAKVTRRTVAETLKNHPDYPSLLSLTDALDEWHVAHAALQLSPEQLAELPVPFVAHIRHTGQAVFAPVQAVRKGTVEWLHHAKGLQREPQETFAQKWTGVALLAEITEQSGEQRHAENHNQETRQALRMSFVWAVLVLGFGALVHHTTQVPVAWNWYGWLLAKTFGVVVSTLLLWQTVDKDNPVVGKLCQLNKKTDCRSVLESSAAKLWGWLGWAEIGFCYFAGGLLALFAGWGNTDVALLLVVLNAAALPFTFYSVYYQAAVAKQWCPLCLAVLALLWLEFLAGTGLWANLLPVSIGFYIMGLLALAFLIPAAGWVFVKPFLLAARQTEPLRDELRKFKNNPDLFLSLLHQQPAMPPVTADMGVVTLGNPAAEHTLTVVTNPFCGPCAEAHAEITQLLEGNPNLKCQVIFAASNDETDRRGQLARYILSLPAAEQAEALHRWYKADKSEQERMLESMSGHQGPNTVRATEAVEKQKTWCDRASITFTPTIYIEQNRKPELYALGDLKHILKHVSVHNATA